MFRYKVIFLITILVLCISSCAKAEKNKEASTDNVTPVNQITSVPDDNTIMPTAIPEAIEENGATTEEGSPEGNTETTGSEPSFEENDITGEESTLAGKELGNQESMQAYEKFLNNETKISFDRFMPEDYMEGALFKEGREYTFSEVLDVLTTFYFEYSSHKKINNIDYGYIDCGKDGINELALRFNGMDIYDMDDDSTLVYIIKYIDGKLTLCYYYETWARSESTMNEYGYYQSGGSNGASNHSSVYSLIDKDGNWQFIEAIEYELDINQLAFSEDLGQLPKVAETKGISGGIELETVCFDSNEILVISDKTDNKERFYTFHVYDDNWEPIEDANLYTDSIYKEIFDEAKIPFVTPDEITAMIAEKEKKVGVTAEIKEGADITWKPLDGNLFSEYVGI